MATTIKPANKILKKSIVVNVRINEDLLAAVDNLAELCERSRSSQIVVMIREWIYGPAKIRKPRSGLGSIKRD